MVFAAKPVPVMACATKPVLMGVDLEEVDPVVAPVVLPIFFVKCREPMVEEPSRKEWLQRRVVPV